MTSPRLLIPELTESQANKYITHNEAVRVIDGLLMPVIQEYTATPPGTPTEGQCWLVGASATGAWAGYDYKVAQYYNTTWYFHTPAVGWWFWNVDAAAFYRYNGSIWSIVQIEAGAKISANDTMPGYLNGKIVSGSRITLTEGNDGGNETLTIQVPDTVVTQALIIAVSDEVTALTTGTNKIKFRMPYPFTLSAVRASLSTAQTSGNILTIDINESGTSILSTKLTIDNTETTSTTANTAAVISDSALADDAEISIDIDQIGDGSAKGLKVTLLGVKG